MKFRLVCEQLQIQCVVRVGMLNDMLADVDRLKLQCS